MDTSGSRDATGLLHRAYVATKINYEFSWNALEWEMLDKILDQLAQAKVYIEYMYAFSDGEKASVAIKPDDMNAALDTLSKNGVEMI